MKILLLAAIMALAVSVVLADGDHHKEHHKEHHNELHKEHHKDHHDDHHKDHHDDHHKEHHNKHHEDHHKEHHEDHHHHKDLKEKATASAAQKVKKNPLQKVKVGPSIKPKAWKKPSVKKDLKRAKNPHTKPVVGRPLFKKHKVLKPKGRKDSAKEKQLLNIPRPAFRKPNLPRPSLPAVNRSRLRALMNNFRNNIRNVVPHRSSVSRPQGPSSATPSLPAPRRPTLPTFNFRNPFRRNVRPQPHNNKNNNVNNNNSINVNSRRKFKLPAIAFKKPESIPGYEKFTLADAVIPYSAKSEIKRSDTVKDVEFIEPRNSENPFLRKHQLKKVKEDETKPTDFELR